MYSSLLNHNISNDWDHVHITGPLVALRFLNVEVFSLQLLRRQSGVCFEVQKVSCACDSSCELFTELHPDDGGEKLVV
jgi:hypothetical protein